MAFIDIIVSKVSKRNPVLNNPFLWRSLAESGLSAILKWVSIKDNFREAAPGPVKGTVVSIRKP